MIIIILSGTGTAVGQVTAIAWRLNVAPVFVKFGKITHKSFIVSW